MSRACNTKAYWTPAEALVWICTRSPERVLAIPNPAGPGAIGYAMRTYALKQFLPTNDDGSMIVGEPELWGHDDWLGFVPERALEELTTRSRDGAIRAQGRRPGSNGFEEILPVEVVDLDLRITPGHPIVPWGFWSRSGDRMAWTLVQFSREDVMGEWRPRTGHHVKAARAKYAISDHLHRVMLPESSLTKQQAMESCRNEISDFYRGAFERAWKQLPAQRKRGRGKHGARLHKVGVPETSEIKPRII